MKFIESWLWGLIGLACFWVGITLILRGRLLVGGLWLLGDVILFIFRIKILRGRKS
jgi:hypothetical protein